MVNYSKEEIKAFNAKDKRISKLAILKSLIGRLSLEDIYEDMKICELTDKYVDYVYSGVMREQTCKKSDTTIVCSDGAEINWKAEAEYANVPVPTPENIKILCLVMDEYKQNVSVEGIDPGVLLSTIYKARGKYPTKESSVPLVLKLI